MPNYVVVQVDPLPAAGAAAKPGSVALVTAATEIAAMDAFAAMTGAVTPVVAQVAPATSFTRYTNTAVVNRTSVAG